ncbi:MAG: hypothetical protein KIS67_00395 [Verrucomicrobiae bacterium]|nr:hypothetical protein [Verrucomicrobiae bacterium]
MPGLLALLLSLYLGLFLAHALVSLVDDSLAAIFHIRFLPVLRGLLSVGAILMSVLIYGLIGLTPMIPKRLFLPLVMFHPLAHLVVIPFLIYHQGWLHPLAWAVSLCQVGMGLAVLYCAQGGFNVRWPLVSEELVKPRRFSWANLLGFLLVNAFVLFPVTVVYLGSCAVLAVDHFSDGFVALRPGGITVQARTYVRDDGKTVQLFPMAHVAERSFYRTLADSFTPDAIVLMEGVTDQEGLLTNRISYRRMAKSLGVVEQEKEFTPTRGEIVHADVDVAEFTANTIGFLNLAMRLHTEDFNVELLLQVLQHSPAPGFERELIEDLLTNRNRHLVEALRSRLAQADKFVVPWGAAHMPEIAREIQKLGFRLNETREFTVMRFRRTAKRGEVGDPKESLGAYE